jgi:hypothetical protein
MTTKQFITRNLRQYVNLAAKQRVYAEYTDNPLEKAAYAARASAYDIMADDMREILEDAEDINKKEPARAGNTDEPKG